MAVAFGSGDIGRMQIRRRGLATAPLPKTRDKMKSLIAQADTAVASGDIFNGQKYIDLAESEVKKLERFVGH